MEYLNKSIGAIGHPQFKIITTRAWTQGYLWDEGKFIRLVGNFIPDGTPVVDRKIPLNWELIKIERED